MELTSEQRFLLMASIAVGFFAWAYNMFEHLNHQSYSTKELDSLEKPFNLFSEQAFYYSYYSDLIDAPTLKEGLIDTVRDARAEYPGVVNALHRFNIYPEMIMGVAYRYFFHPFFPDRFDFTMFVCFAMTGLHMVATFYTGAELGKSILCGFFAAVMVLMNFFEVTRVHNHPMLRETFAIPFLWVEVGVMAYNLRLAEPTKKSLFCLAVSTFSFMLPWQFAQFPMLIQAFALFLIYCIGYVSPNNLAKIYLAQLVALLVCAVAMFFNEMLITSMLFFFLIGGLMITQIDSKIQFKNPIAHVGVRLCILAGIVAGLKVVSQFAFGIEDDAHIFLILRAHLTGYEDFITLQYLCGQAFNPMPGWAFQNLTDSLVLPLGAISMIVMALKVAFDYKDGNTRDPITPFLLAQSCGFILLGLLMLRMLPFFTPSWILCASMVFTDSYDLLLPGRWYTPSPASTIAADGAQKEEKGGAGKKKDKPKVQKSTKSEKASPHVQVIKYMFRALLGVAILLAPYERFNAQMMGTPRRANYEDKVELVQWIINNTDQDAVITASLDASSWLKLYTRRRFTVHPHAEKPEIRERYRYQYQSYARVPEKDVYDAMRHLQSDYMVLTNCGAVCTNNKGYDYIASKNGLSKVDLSQPLFCNTALTQPNSLKYFNVVYNKNRIAILKLKKFKKKGAKAEKATGTDA